MAHKLYFRMQSSSIVIARSKTTKQSPLVGQASSLSIGMTGKMPVPLKMRLLRVGALAMTYSWLLVSSNGAKGVIHQLIIQFPVKQ